MTTQTSVKESIISCIKENSLGSLATVSPEGNPRSAFVYFAVDENLKMYFMTRSDTKKYTHLSKNRHVAISIANENGYETIQAEGIADEVQSTATQLWMIEELAKNAAKHPTWQLPINQMETSGLVFICVSLTWVRWAKFHKETGENMFEELTF